MLFRLLKFFGLDVGARIAAFKAGIEQRVALATGHYADLAQQAAIIAALGTLAGITGCVAIAIGFVALYIAVADAWGVYAGLGAVGGVMLLACAILATIAAVRARRLSNPAAPAGPFARPIVSSAVEPAALLAEPAAVPPVASARDLLEPMTSFLASISRSPGGYGSFISMLASDPQRASGAARAVLDRAADVVRKGDRANLALVLTGAALAGWVVARGRHR